MPSLRALPLHVRFAASHPRECFAVHRVKERRLTFLERAALYDLVDVVKDLERVGAEGAIVEAGCALGGSAIVLAASKSPERPMEVYDVFGQIPEPGAQDDEDVHARYAEIAAGKAQGVGGDSYYGYRQDLYSEVRQSFRAFGLPVESNNVRLIKGLFEDTLHPAGPIALAHIDCDWYDPVMTCLTRLFPLLSPGGRIVLDDYDAWSGCRKAADAFFAELDPNQFRLERRSRLHAVKR
jgi:asparagine synthase (glutamine-hydrolysing)